MTTLSWLARTHRAWRLTQLPLGVEIALLLAVKIGLLTILAQAFFSEPQAKHMHMAPALVEQHLLSAAGSPSDSVSSHSSTNNEVTHASH